MLNQTQPEQIFEEAVGSGDKKGLENRCTETGLVATMQGSMVALPYVGAQDRYS